jgi:hypothetical protein
MDAYTPAYVDDDMGDDITIPAHLLTAQHLHFLACFQPHFQSIFSPFAIYFQPIYILFLAYLHSGF